MNADADGADAVKNRVCSSWSASGWRVAAVLIAAVASGAVRADETPMELDSVVVGDEGIEAVPVQDPAMAGVPDWSGPAPEPIPCEPSGCARAKQCGPRWDVTVDALMLWQGNAQSLPLLVTPTGSPVANAQDLQTQMAGGVRVGLIRSLGERYAIEGNYFQARPFDASEYVPASGEPYTLTNTGNLTFNDIESATLTSNGWIQSAELNWRKNECWSPITWLAGFRWVELNSQVNLDYRFVNANPDESGTGLINTNVGNNLYGGQMGADMRLWNKGGRWRANAVGKAGIFYNSASFQRSTAGRVTDAGKPSTYGTVAATADQTSFFGEVGLNSTYRITDWLAWRAGYTVMWAAGVAVAPQQLPLNTFGPPGTATINTNGSVLLHGVTTGIEARW